MHGIRKRRSSGAPERGVRNTSQGAFLEIQYISWTHIPSKPVRTGSQIRREDNKESGGSYCGNTEVTWKCIFFWACWSSSTHCGVFSFDLQFPPRCFFLLTYFKIRLADLCYMWGAGQKRWHILAFGLITLIIMRGTCPLVRSMGLSMYSIPM